MKTVLIAGLGVVIWAASWLAPQVNLVLTPPVMLALVTGLTAVLSLSIVLSYLNQHRPERRCPGGDCRRDGYDSRTRPVPVPVSR